MPGTLPRLPLARTLSNRFLTETCRVDRPSAPTSDSAGGSTETVPSGISYACAVIPHDVQPSEGLVGSAIVAESVWHIRLPAGTSIQPTDRIVQTSITPTRTFEVLSARTPRTLEAQTIALCRLVT
jgi:hypothetical protein